MGKAYLKDLQGSLGEASLHDLCYSASVRRTHHDHRAVVVFSSREELITRLQLFVAGKAASGTATGRGVPGRAPRIAFVFSGHGSQWWGMGRRLLVEEISFRTVVQQCDELLRPFADWSLWHELNASESDSRLDAKNEKASLEISQVALFAFQVALTAMWRSLGVKPAGVVGHSMGEIAAAHVAGALSLADAVRVIFHRSHLMQERLQTGCFAGAMALVRMSRAAAEEALAGYGGEISLAAHNAPLVTLLSGEEAALREMLRSFKTRGIASRLARVPGAGHCSQIEPLRGELIAILNNASGVPPFQAQPSNIPIFSTVTGCEAPGETFDAQYWGRNLREPVLFAEAIGNLRESGFTHFLEISPEPLLVSAIQQCLGQVEVAGKALPTTRRGEPSGAGMLEALGRLYVDGFPVAWPRLYPHGSCVALPSYPWQRERFWLPRTAFASINVGRHASDEPAVLEESFYHLAWEDAAESDDNTNMQSAAAPTSWLIFADRGHAADGLRTLLGRKGDAYKTVFPGREYRQVAPGEWEIDPECPEHFQRLLRATQHKGGMRGIVHLWSLDAVATARCDLTSLDRARDLGCISVLHLIQALAQENHSPPPRLWLVTAGVQFVPAEPGEIAIAQAPLWALGRVIRFEHPEFRCRMVDLSSAGFAQEMPALVRELGRHDEEDHIALRHGRRYRARLARGISPDGPLDCNASGPEFAADATYLIVGGFGGLGLTTARWMVENGARHFALLGRRPPCEAAADFPADLTEKDVKVRAMRADVVNPSDMEQVLAEVRGTMPPLRGIIHAAAHLDNGLLRHLERDRFSSVMAPKVHGAWNLHSLTLNDELDFFVMFSSAASLLGTPGHANYAAANAFLDALAQYRVSIGLPGLSVNWGPWSRLGLAARLSGAERLAQLGFDNIAPEQGVKALGCLMLAHTPQAAVIPVNWPKVQKAYPSAARWPLLAQQWEQGRDALDWMPASVEKQNALDDTSQDSAALPEDFVPPATAMEQKLAALWMEVSGARRVSIHDNFLTLGGDSLMAVQLLSQISALTPQEVSAQLLISNPTIALLAKALENMPVPSSSVGPVIAVESSNAFRTEHRPLLSLSTTGNLPPVRAAALCYLSQSYLQGAGLAADDVAENWCHNLPTYVDRIDTPLGPIALILLPLREAQLYADRQLLVKTIVEALEMAKQLGAHSASLMGLLPSASDYGRAVKEVIAERNDLPQITTGHATTAAAVVLNLAGILQRAGRDLAGEQLAILGLGSVGMATLRLLLKSMPQPASLLLCDVYAKRELLDQIRQEVFSVWGDANRVKVVESGDEVPQEVYEATLIVGATNVPGIVEIERVKPGTILVDDSAPHCFAPRLAIRRFEQDRDILFTEGGMMRSPQQINHVFYMPRSAQSILQGALASAINPFHIPGCILSSLLSFSSDELKPTTGFVDTENSVRHYNVLRKIGFQAGDLHCEDYVLATESIAEFRRVFGRC